MQRELDAENLPVPVRILGVNAVGQEGDNSLICQGRDIPWLQDTPDEAAWGAWEAIWRDVVVLDTNNERVDVYNLTSQSLATSDYYEQLKGILRAAATAAGSP